jgi:hypothetical protein
MSEYQEYNSLSHLFLNLLTRTLRSYFQHIYFKWLNKRRGDRTRKFMTLFTGTPHQVLYWANWIHSTLSSQSPLVHFWSHSSVYTSVFPVVSFLRAIPPKPCTLFSLPGVPLVPHTSFALFFFCLMILGDEYETPKLFNVQFPAFSLAGLWFSIF